MAPESEDTARASSPPKSPLALALERAAKAPTQEAAWDELEERAVAAQRPEDVAALYREVLKSLPAEALSRIGARALAFHEEWFGDTPERLIDLLRGLLARDPTLAWATERLTLLLSVSQQWDTLLAVYDELLVALKDGPPRRKLLEEAAGVAKDFLGSPERAIRYLTELWKSRPTDTHVAASLERLLDKEQRYAELETLWEARLALMSGTEAAELRARLAHLRLDHLGHVAGALGDAQALLKAREDDAACLVLERILKFPGATPAQRQSALSLLRNDYERQGDQGRIVEALETAHAFASGEEKLRLLREAAERLVARNDNASAMDRLVELLALSPGDAPARVRLHQLAEISERFDVYVEGLLGAAEAADDERLRAALWLEAARTEHEVRGRHGEAATLLRKVADAAGADQGQRLTALRRASRLEARFGEPEARLEVLERLALLAPELPERQAALGQAARLATQLGQDERALAAWEARLALVPADFEALDALVEALTRGGQSERLAEVLRARAETTPHAESKRADLVRLARVQSEALRDPALAIETWLEVERRFGEDATSAQALVALLASTGAFEELARRLARLAAADKAALVGGSVRLGNVLHTRLDKPREAALAYATALALAPEHAEARLGLEALRSTPAAAALAVEALARAFTETRDWAKLVALTDARLERLGDPGAEARLLAELAGWVERDLGDGEQARTLLAKALVRAPDNARLEQDLLRLCTDAPTWRFAVETLEQAAQALPEGASRKVALLVQRARLLEAQLDQPRAAMAGYEAASRLAPDRNDLKLAVVRLGGALADFNGAAEAVLRAPVSTEVVKGSLLPAYEHAAKASGAFADAARALAETLSKRTGLPEALVRDVEGLVATWYEQHVEGPEGTTQAEAAWLRAARQSPHHVATWERLASLQRKRPGRPLFETLVQLGALDPRRLDVAAEALRVARDTLRDTPLTVQRGFALLGQVSLILRNEQPVTGELDPAAAAELAVAVLVETLLSSGNRQDAVRAVNVLTDVATWPLPVAFVRGLRRKAATTTLEVLGDKGRARALLRAVVEDAPEDREAIGVLAGLLEEADLLSEVLSVRRRELALALPRPERLALRLEMSRVAGLIETRSARVSTLLANLEEAPGDEATLAALSTLLGARGQHAELADILGAQAKSLEEQGQLEQAAAMWGRMAALAETQLGDLGRALAGYEKMVAHAPAPAPLDALARLCMAKAEPRAAAAWLEQRLVHAEGGERSDVCLRLAQAYLASGQRHRATGTLERALAEAPAAHELRALLVDTYRDAEAWEPLARTLAAGCAEALSSEQLLAYAQEAAALYQGELAEPERAVSVLELALRRLPAERGLRTRLAESLRVAGRNEEARKVLAALLEEMGRRRSKERAAIHHQLALVARAEGDLPAALDHLEQASAMDVGTLRILLDLAETAASAQALDRAERAYQALLVMARRTDTTDVPLSAGEILLRLEAVAKARGDEATAAERLDSAMALALQSGHEAQRLQAAFLTAGQVERAVALLDKRAAAAGSGAAEAQALCDKARLFERQERLEDALAAIALALEKAPDLDEAHDLGRRLARALGDPERYLGLVEEAMEQMRRRDDGARMCTLLMRAGAVAEEDVKDPERAARAYARAEQTGHHLSDVLVAVARLAGAAGDKDEESRALRALARLAESAADPDAQAQLRFRVAELQLRAPETRGAGLETLAAALDRVPDFARAQAIVREANVPEDELPRVMPLYERVARASGDDHMLLDFLERRAAFKDVTQAEVSEAVELAVALGHSDRAERLLERAVALAGQQGEAREAGWALFELAQRRRARHDLHGAFKWLVEAQTAADGPRIPMLLREVAREATRQTNGARLAAEVYETLRARNPADKELWQPLIELYEQLGDEDKLRAVIAETLEKLLDRQDRIQVRLVWARHLLRTGQDDAEASSVYRDVMMEEPGHRESLMALAELHERRGDVSEAVALLSEALREAEVRGDADWQAETSRRLGDLLGKADTAQAKQVYRQALASHIPDPALKRSLQQSLLDLLDDDERQERAALGEALLADEAGAAAGARALQLAELYASLGNHAAERRVLEQGRQRAPGEASLFERLAVRLEAEDAWDAWAALMDEEATRLATFEPEAAARILRQAAATRRERLADTAGAATLLRKAAALQPADVAQVRELVNCLRQMGDAPSAIVAVGETLMRTDLAAARGALHRLRAELHIEAGEVAAAVEDLEAAFPLEGPAVAEPLTDALFLLAARAGEQADLPTERRAMLRLADVFSAQGQGDKAQELLFRWVDHHPEDRDALQALRGRFETANQWEDVTRVCLRLVEMEAGEARIEAALGLAHAYELLGRAHEAMPTLEKVLGEHPGQPAVLNILTMMYEQAGDRRKVAALRIQAAETILDEEERLHVLTEGADLFLQEGDPQSAVGAINKAFALRPEDRVVQRLLADTLLATGQYGQAMAMLERLVTDVRGVDGGELCALHHRMARAAEGLGDAQGQLAALRKALEADRRNGAVAAELADLAEAMGDDDLALKALQSISLSGHEGPLSVAMSFFRRARIAAKNGDRQRALIFAKRALEEDSTLTEAQQLLEQVR